MAERFRRHVAGYFTFLKTGCVPPTNNLTEWAIRFVVIDRKVSRQARQCQPALV